MNKLAAYIGIAVAAVGGVYAINRNTETAIQEARHHAEEVLRKNQLAACKRGNDLRAKIQENNEIVKQLFLTAAGARAQEGEAAIAHRYEYLTDRLKSQNQVDCFRVIQRPH